MKPRPPHQRRSDQIWVVRRELVTPRERTRWTGLRLGVLLLIAALVTSAGLWLMGRRTAAESPVVAVRVGVVEEALVADGLIIRREQVIAAPVSGRVRRLAAEGERVRVGAPVVEIGPAEATTAPGQATAPPGQATAPQPQPAAGLAAAQQEFDRLSGELHRLAVALNHARYNGQGEQVAQVEQQMDDLARQQAALLPLLGRAAAPATPRPPSRDSGGTRAGTSPALNPAATPVHAGGAGTVIYQTDGLESVVTPEGVATWTPNWLRSLPFPELVPSSEGIVRAGQPLFKVVDDLDLELALLVPAARLTPARRAELLADGVQLRIPGREKPFWATVKRIAQEGEELLMHLAVPLPATEALKVRRIKVTLVLETHQGIVVPRSSIDVQGGVQGVWVLNGRSYQFVPVTVKGGNGQEVAVSGDLTPDARVLWRLPPPATPTK